MTYALEHSVFQDCTCGSAANSRVTPAASLLLVARVIQRWNQRSRQRMVLRDLDEQQLNDIGVTRAGARREAAKPFWA